jgi:hypothetical protein
MRLGCALRITHYTSRITPFAQETKTPTGDPVLDTGRGFLKTRISGGYLRIK